MSFAAGQRCVPKCGTTGLRPIVLDRLDWGLKHSDGSLVWHAVHDDGSDARYWSEGYLSANFDLAPVPVPVIRPFAFRAGQVWRKRTSKSGFDVIRLHSRSPWGPSDWHVVSDAPSFRGYENTGYPEDYIRENYELVEDPAPAAKTGECPCGGTWGVCTYHGGPLPEAGGR